MTTSVRQMNDLCGLLDTLVDRITAEHNVELPKERRDAKGDTELLAALGRRKADLTTAFTMHKDAKAAYMAAKAAYKVDPTEMDARYAEALGLAARIEAILDFRTAPKDDTKGTKTDGDPAPKPDPAKGKDETDGKPVPVPAPDSTDSDDSKAGKAKEKKDGDKSKTDPESDADKAKGKEKDKPAKPEPTTDPVLAAIAKLGEDCRNGNDELRKEIAGVSDRLTEIAKGTLPEELAQILKDLDPEAARILASLSADQLTTIINRQELTPLGGALMNVLAAYTPEELTTMLANLAAFSGKAEKIRRAFPGGKHK